MHKRKMHPKWKGNLLEIEEWEKSVLIAGIRRVCRKAVIRMEYYPEIC